MGLRPVSFFVAMVLVCFEGFLSTAELGFFAILVSFLESPREEREERVRLCVGVKKDGWLCRTLYKHACTGQGESKGNMLGVTGNVQDTARF